MITIGYNNKEFTVQFRYDANLVSAIKTLPRRRWNPQQKAWTVPETHASDLQALLSRVNVEMISYQGGADTIIKQQTAQRELVLAKSRATDADVTIPAPEGLSYLPFQRAGIAYAMERPAVLFGDEMGLGKTIQAIGVLNADTSLRSVLVICPASLKINWARELNRWLVHPLSIGIANGGGLPTTDIVVINYDIVRKHSRAVKERAWDALIVDECHYLKNGKAQRTQQILGKWDEDESKRIPAIQARRRLFLTGTPILNRPVELWSVIHALDPYNMGRSWKQYVTRYCAGYQNEYGWDVSGASNLPELQDRLRTKIMVRRLKSEVLKELPAKRRAVIVLPADGAGSAVKAEADGYAHTQSSIDEARAAVELAKANGTDDEYEAAVERLTSAARTAFTEIAKLRHAVAVAKVPAVIEYLRDLVETEKIVVFAHHHDVVAAIAAEFPACVTLTGESSQEQRQAAVDRFQHDEQCNPFIGSIHAAGVGLTLTAASHVVFAELDWVPGNITQAEDRCHRIGQQASVLVEHLVLDGSLDVVMAQTLVDKQNVIDAALDDATRAELSRIVITPSDSAAASTSRKKINEDAIRMTPEMIAATHTALQMLAGMCDGAIQLDGRGFNKLDTRIGHELAALPSLTPRQAALGMRIAQKYRRQLPPELVAVITTERRML